MFSSVIVVMIEKLVGFFFNLIGCQCAFVVTSHVRQHLRLCHLLVAIKVDSSIDFVKFAPNDVVNLFASKSLIKRQHLIVVSVQPIKGLFSVKVVHEWMFIAQALISLSGNSVIKSFVCVLIEDLFDQLLVQVVAIMLFSIDLAVRVVVTISKLLIDENLVRSESLYISLKPWFVFENMIDFLDHVNGLAQVSSIIRFATIVILALISLRLASQVVKLFIFVSRCCDGLIYNLRFSEVLRKFNYHVRVIVHSNQGIEVIVFICRSVSVLRLIKSLRHFARVAYELRVREYAILRAVVHVVELSHCKIFPVEVIIVVWEDTKVGALGCKSC